MITTYMKTMRNVNNLIKGICNIHSIQTNTNLNESKCYEMIVESGITKAINSITSCDKGEAFNEIAEIIANRIVIMLPEYLSRTSRDIDVDKVFFEDILKAIKEAFILD